MRSIFYGSRKIEVEIISLARPRDAGLMSRGHPAVGEATLTLLSPVELPLGAQVKLDNAEDAHFDVRVRGCAPREDGRFVILGTVE